MVVRPLAGRHREKVLPLGGFRALQHRPLCIPTGLSTCHIVRHFVWAYGFWDGDEQLVGMTSMDGISGARVNDDPAQTKSAAFDGSFQAGEPIAAHLAIPPQTKNRKRAHYPW